MSDEARQQPGSGYPPEGLPPSSPWAEKPGSQPPPPDPGAGQYGPPQYAAQPPAYPVQQPPQYPAQQPPEYPAQQPTYPVQQQPYPAYPDQGQPVSVPPLPVSVPPQQVSGPPVPYVPGPQPAQSSWPTPTDPMARSWPSTQPSRQPSTPPAPWSPAPAEPKRDSKAAGGGRTGGLVWSIVAAVAVGALAGAGGYLVGTGGSIGGAKPQATPTGQAPTTTPSPTLGAFAKTQLAINKPKFDGDLAPLAAPWLADMGSCETDTEPGGPKLTEGQAKRVSCRYNGVGLNFVRFNTPADRDGARMYRSRLAASGASLAPGQASPGPTKGVEGKPGAYVEYALKDSSGRSLCGIWWNPDEGSAAMYLEAGCADVLGNDWEPLRELWRQHI